MNLDFLYEIGDVLRNNDALANISGAIVVVSNIVIAFLYAKQKLSLLKSKPDEDTINKKLDIMLDVFKVVYDKAKLHPLEKQYVMNKLQGLGEAIEPPAKEIIKETTNTSLSIAERLKQNKG